MGVRVPYTPTSRIKQALHVLWMRSRERGQALRNTGYTCCYCKRKQSTAKGKELKLDVHHLDGIKWDQIIAFIRKELLQDPSRLAPACRECHEKITGNAAKADNVTPCNTK